MEKNVLVIGSSVIDLFLEITDQSKFTIKNRAINFALGDKIPTDITKITLGGNGANISVGLKRLGVDSSFYTFFGSDLFSKEIENNLKKEGINLMAIKSAGKSSISFILHAGTDRIIFSHHEIHPHNFSFSDQTLPDFIYLTSIGETWQKAYEEIFEFASQNSIPVFFSPGSPQLEKKTEIIGKFLRSAYGIFVNKEEAQKLLSWEDLAKNSPLEILNSLSLLGIKIISVTDSINGAYARGEDGDFKIDAPGKTEPVVEKTGAGDAYASGFLAGLARGEKTPFCMRQGALNAFSVLQEIGAQEGLSTQQEMADLLLKKTGIAAVKI